MSVTDLTTSTGRIVASRDQRINDALDWFSRLVVEMSDLSTELPELCAKVCSLSHYPHHGLPGCNARMWLVFIPVYPYP